MFHSLKIIFIIFLFSAIAIDAQEHDEGPVADSVSIQITSSPDSVSILLDNKLLKSVTPSVLRVISGKYLIETFQEGYEPLAQKIDISGGQKASMNFMLKKLPPPRITANSMGLEIKKMPTTRNESEAAEIRKWWGGLAETFAIVPLGQGVIAKLILDDDSQKEADVLIVTGAILTIGSYLAGRFFSFRRRQQILAENNLIIKANDDIRLLNRDIEKLVKDSNSVLIDNWMIENDGRGTVELKVE